jgi:VIT1/CCC1 family predicted Fe2+/Mn2+ transporter
MPSSPVALFFTLAVVMTVTALVTVYVRTRYFGFRPNRWTWVAWGLTAAVVCYFLIQGVRHA